MCRRDTHVVRLIGALLKMEPVLADSKLVVIDSGYLAPAVQYNNKQFKIDRRWLTYDGIHEIDPCDSPTFDKNADPTLFRCDHAVRLAWDSLLDSATTHVKLAVNIPRLRSLAHVKIQQMPRNIRCMTNEAKDELIVSWTSMEPQLDSTKPLKVTAHWIGCTVNVNCHDGTYDRMTQGKSVTQCAWQKPD
jgi:hypothetical protein